MLGLLHSAERGSKRYRHGTHRVCPPAETLDRYLPLMPRFGITRLANLTGLDTVGLPVYAAYRPLSRTVVTSLGKGLDPLSAKASALMESIELWHAEWLAEPARWGSYPELLAGANVVDLGGLPIARGGRVDLDEPRGWTDGVDLVSGQPLWVPFEMVSLNLVHRTDFSVGLLRTSNGLASGNHVLEALAHALCEVIERDADARWRASTQTRRLDLATVTDPDAIEVLNRLAAAGLRTAVWDLTSEVGVPAYGATILTDPRDGDWRAVGVHEGAGCHRSPAVALNRALTEAAQVRLTCIAGSRDDIHRDELARANDVEVAEQIWAELDEIPATERFPGLTEEGESLSLAEDVRWLLDRLTGAGIDQVAVVDLTLADVGVPVVKVLVPGLLGPAGDCEPTTQG